MSERLGARNIALVSIALMLCTAHGAVADVFGIIHRGGRMQGPENTLEVFQLTMDLDVTPWLETDSWVSADGVPILHHDRDMCRTTNIGDLPGYDCTDPLNNPLGRLPWIQDFTLAELKALDVGSWFAPEWAGTQMPTLEEALQLVDGTGFPLLVEIKTGGQGLLIKEILDRTGLSWSNIIVWARKTPHFDDFHSVLPGIRQISGQFPLEEVTDQLLQERVAAGDYGIAVLGVDLTQDFVDRVQSRGLFLYTIPTDTGADPFPDRFALGVDGIHTANELEWETILASLPCMDRIDNDGDGYVDFDGVDVDFDLGRVVDIPADNGCSDRFAVTELAACQDNIDNDHDGLTDLDDSDCLDANDRAEGITLPALSNPARALLAAALVVMALSTPQLAKRRSRRTAGIPSLNEQGERLR